MYEDMSPEALLSDAIRAIGAPDFISELLDYMRSVAAFRGAFVVALSHDGPPEYLYDNVRAERRAIVIDRWLDGAWVLDPFVVSFLKKANDPVMVLSDVSPDRFAKSNYYDTYYKSVKLGDELALFVPLPERTLFFSLGRLAGEKRFSRRDVGRLTIAHPIVSALCEQHFGRTAPMAPGAAPVEISLAIMMERVGKDLTEREVEVVQHILRGHSSQSAALLMDLSPATVKVHRKNIYRKLGISSQSALFSLFLQSVSSPG